MGKAYKNHLKTLTDMLQIALLLEVILLMFGYFINEASTILFVLTAILFAPALLGYFVVCGKVGGYFDRKLSVLLQRMKGREVREDIHASRRFFTILFALLPVFFYIAFGLASELYKTSSVANPLLNVEFYLIFIGLVSVFIIFMVIKTIFSSRLSEPEVSTEVERVAREHGFIQLTEEGMCGSYKGRKYYIDDFLEGMVMKTENPYHRYIPLTLMDPKRLRREVGEETAAVIQEYGPMMKDMDFDADWFRIILHKVDKDDIPAMLELMEAVIENVRPEKEG